MSRWKSELDSCSTRCAPGVAVSEGQRHGYLYDHLGQRKHVALAEDEARRAYYRSRPFDRLSDFLKATDRSQKHKGCCLHGKCCAAKRRSPPPHPEPSLPQAGEKEFKGEDCSSQSGERAFKADGDKQSQKNEQGQAAQSEGENVARKRKPRCTRAEKRRRLATLARFLEASASPEQIYDYAKTHWQIGKRSVQLYIRQIKQRWADEASREDYLAALWKSHKQQEALIFKAFQVLDKIQEPRLLVHLLRTTERLIKARNETLADLMEHRRATKRDRSLDGIPAKCLRGKRVSFTVDELMQRIERLRDLWQHMAREEQADMGDEPCPPQPPPAPQPAVPQEDQIVTPRRDLPPNSPPPFVDPLSSRGVT